jgi:hypothetical protein
VPPGRIREESLRYLLEKGLSRRKRRKIMDQV